MKESTVNNRQKKAERREAKANRKAANKIEEEKHRPNNILLAVLIFGIIIGMFGFVGGYKYYKKSPSIEKYMKDKGIVDVYKSFVVDEYTTAALKADGNTMKIVYKISEDAPEDTVKTYKGEDGEKELKDTGAYFLTNFKPETRGFNGKVKVAAKQGDERINYVEMNYYQAKRYIKQRQKEVEKEEQ